MGHENEMIIKKGRKKKELSIGNENKEKTTQLVYIQSTTPPQHAREEASGHVDRQILLGYCRCLISKNVEKKERAFCLFLC